MRYGVKICRYMGVLVMPVVVSYRVDTLLSVVRAVSFC